MTLSDLALSRAAVDRRAEWRTSPTDLDRAWHDPAARVLQLATTTSFPVRADRTGLALTAALGSRGPDVLFLGLSEGGAFFARLPSAAPPETDVPTATLRDVGALFTARDTGLAVHATALASWHSTHGHCPRCGAATTIESAGHTRRCPVDSSQHYPRTDPAVIMAVVDDDERLLLGRQAAWPERRFSTLAGFVEPGESLEAAVRREVAEEVGVTVEAVTYQGSQPWPFPASLMLGFVARAPGSEVPLRPDQAEIAEAAWFTREGLRAAVARGDVRLPPAVSIARQLIEQWLAESLLPVSG